MVTSRAQSKQKNDEQIFRNAVVEIGILDEAMSVLGWDQETYLPKGASSQRAETLGVLSRLRFEKISQPKLKKLIRSLSEQPKTSPWTKCNLRETQIEVARASQLSADLVERLARHQSEGVHAWFQAKSERKFSSFLPAFKKAVRLAQERADALRRGTKRSRYEALLDLYEPGWNAVDLRQFLNDLRDRLQLLLTKVQESPRFERVQKLETLFHRPLSVSEQESIGQALVERLGFDLQKGRIDASNHPFCSGTLNDVRLTTRFNVSMPFDCWYSLLHEAGHGIYEQNLPAKQAHTFAARAASFGVHESQSRLWENGIGRSEEFSKFLTGFLHEHARDTFGRLNPQDLFAALNIVKPSLIRVDADELTYNFHILLRFEIEMDLIEGNLRPEDAEEVWNEKMQSSLSVSPAHAAEGILQDIHWGHGSFGYFPSYTLGNVMAAQWLEAAKDSVAHLQTKIAAGEFHQLREWLTEHIHRHGRRYSATQLLKKATGQTLQVEPMLDLLEQKYKKIYGF